MIIFKEKQGISSYLADLQREGKTIGFVPTMGAIHAGHLSLIRAAAEASDVTVCSIFVNPTQFNDPEDFAKYPVTTEDDIRQLMAGGTDILFLPSVNEVYEQGTQSLETYPFGALENVLEGAFRPGHFQGVGQVMERLLRIVHPDKLFMGQKDAQQVMVINKLLEITHIKTELIACPILREKDGLAMSSRNVRLSSGARKKAPLIYQTLQFVKAHVDEMPLKTLLAEAAQKLEQHGFHVDYLVIADGDLQIPDKPGGKKLTCLVAAWIDGVRLIDNLPLS